jgi:hypothetical protein
MNIFRDPPYLKRREAAAHDFPRAPVKRRHIFRCRAAIPVKQRKRARDVGFGGLAVTLAHKGRCLHEPCGYL